MKYLSIGLGALVIALTVTERVHAGPFYDSQTLNDYYIGGVNHGRPFDVIGPGVSPTLANGEPFFAIESSRLQLSGTTDSAGKIDSSTVTGQVTVNTTFANWSSSQVGGVVTGGLFFTDAYDPDRSGDPTSPSDPHWDEFQGKWYGLNDHALTTGTHWKYVFAPKESDLTGTSGALELWALADTSDAVLNSRDFFTPQPPGFDQFRDFQAVTVDRTYSGNVKLSDNAGTWTRTSATSSSGTYGAYYDAGTMTFSNLDLAGTGLVSSGGQLAWRWTMSCGNDALEQVTALPSSLVFGPPPPPPAPVPLPSTLMVYSSFTILGLFRVRRKRRTTR